MRFGKVDGIRRSESLQDRVRFHTGERRVGPTGVAGLQLDGREQPFVSCIINGRVLLRGASARADGNTFGVFDRNVAPAFIEPKPHHKTAVAAFVFSIIKRAAVGRRLCDTGKSKTLRQRRDRLLRVVHRRGEHGSRHCGKKQQCKKQNSQTKAKGLHGACLLKTDLTNLLYTNRAKNANAFLIVDKHRLFCRRDLHGHGADVVTGLCVHA